MHERNARVYAAVSQIPYGRVATYGQVAALSGMYGQARQVGYVMFGIPDDSELPWHRVINARGEISARSMPGADVRQRARLEAEGVEFDRHGRVALNKFAWKPIAQADPDAQGALW